MPTLTDSVIRHAIRQVETERRQKVLSDGEGRGTGQLILLNRCRHASPQWLVQQWCAGRRTKSKIGSYPAMSLPDTREVFQRALRSAP